MCGHLWSNSRQVVCLQPETATGLGQFTDKVNVTHNDDWSSLASSAAKSGNEITSEYVLNLRYNTEEVQIGGTVCL
jgi:hypothetical protein